MTTGSDASKDIVYGEVQNSLVFISRKRASKLATIHEVLSSSSTWGQLRSRLPQEVYQEFLELASGGSLMTFDEFSREELRSNPNLTRDELLKVYRDRTIAPGADVDRDMAAALIERAPEDDDPFTAGNIGVICDGDWPGWPAQEMLTWVPKPIQKQYGKGSFSFVSGDCLLFEPSREREIVASFEKLGYRCVRDDATVRRASGHSL
jgi:hypothetical protein